MVSRTLRTVSSATSEESALDREIELLSLLKPGQWDLFTLIAHGQSLDRMCSVLGMSHKTLRLQITRLYEALHLRTDEGQAIRKLYPLAQQEGWLD